jgi:hypothetical protein
VVPMPSDASTYVVRLAHDWSPEVMAVLISGSATLSDTSVLVRIQRMVEAALAARLHGE